MIGKPNDSAFIAVISPAAAMADIFVSVHVKSVVIVPVFASVCAVCSLVGVFKSEY